MTTYDYIIMGAGASGLMLADGLGRDSYFRNKSILLIDKNTKQTNDRTWCFWEKGAGDFDHIVYKSWEQILFAGTNFEYQKPISPYIYKMVKGIDFYKEYLGRITKLPNISMLSAEVLDISSAKNGVQVQTNAGTYHCKKAFNSILDITPILAQKEFPVLQQHFLGWFVKTEKPTFDDRSATFMDFSIPQKGNTRFLYVLPFSKTEALLEYTLFSETLLPKQEYEDGLRDYLKRKLKCSKYSISEVEIGSIPMTCYDFSSANSENLFHIGTAGGWTKASTGFTFMNTYRKTQSLILYLKKDKSMADLYKNDRFWFYDLLLLEILYRKNHMGQPIFESLFKRRSPQLIFKFLDGDTSLLEDLKIISACPKREFIGALLRRIF